MEAMVCQAVSYSEPFAQTALLANFHCNEPLVWSETSGFYYTISTGSSLRIPFLSPAVVLCQGDPAALALHSQLPS